MTFPLYVYHSDIASLNLKRVANPNSNSNLKKRFLRLSCGSQGLCSEGECPTGQKTSKGEMSGFQQNGIRPNHV